MFLGSGKKPEYLERTHAYAEMYDHPQLGFEPVYQAMGRLRCSSSPVFGKLLA